MRASVVMTASATMSANMSTDVCMGCEWAERHGHHMNINIEEECCTNVITSIRVCMTSILQGCFLAIVSQLRIDQHVATVFDKLARKDTVLHGEYFQMIRCLFSWEQFLYEYE